MAKSSREQADRNREVIEDVSARLFRERGLNGISVATLMGAAGLTHGGFYGHFSSKDELAALACAKAFDETTRKWTRRIEAAAGDREAMRSNIVDPYLTAAHRDTPGEGCAAAALASDIAREAEDKPVRQAYVDGFKSMVHNWMKTVPEDDDDRRRSRALIELSAMVGALVLARATCGDPMSDEILDAARDYLIGNSRARASAH
jgi:TetR/AcrR family transcriptional repressor of nem operon